MTVIKRLTAPSRSRLGTVFALIACAVLSSCQTSNTKILIGATARIGAQGPEIPDAVIIIAGGRIRLVSARKDAPIAQDSERIDLSGKWIVPTPGNRLEANQPASLLILDSSSSSDVSRRMTDGEWAAP